jgi:hypothetical protein
MKLAGNRLVRHLVSGDWLRQDSRGRKILDRVFVRTVIALHRSCPWLIGWGYTHAAEKFNAAGITPDTLPTNLHILASCDSLAEKEAHNSKGWRTARVIAERDDKTADEFLCPVDAQKREGVPQVLRTNCARCQACFAGTRNIAFLKF